MAPTHARLGDRATSRNFLPSVVLVSFARGQGIYYSCIRQTYTTNMLTFIMICRFQQLVEYMANVKYSYCTTLVKGYHMQGRINHCAICAMAWGPPPPGGPRGQPLIIF